jgi:hypothetical protein
MSERERNRDGKTDREQPAVDDSKRLAAGDPREECLRAVFALADPPLKPSETLRQRVAEVIAQHEAPVPRRGPWWSASLRQAPIARATAAVLLLAGLGLAVARWSHERAKVPQAPRSAQQPSPERTPWGPLPAPQRMAIETARPSLAPARPVPPPTTEHAGWPARPAPRHIMSSIVPLVKDTAVVNGDPTQEIQRWVAPSANGWDALEARVRRKVPVRDDFVQIPFPRIADAVGGQIVAAVESYKREAAIVDARLAREVALQQKATALSDLCDRLRADTGIHLVAGSSVADEKVTLFCQKLPLRDVMRQLSRPFGYAWIRSGKVGEYRYELVQDLRSQLLEEELRNRDRNEALLALEQEIERFRPYLSLSPDEVVARAKTAPPEEKKLLEKLGGGNPRSGLGWGPIQMYFRLSAQEKAALRAGEKLYFSEGPRLGERPLPPDVARGVLQSWRFERALKVPDGFRITEAEDPDGMPIPAIPGMRASVSVWLGHGQSTLEGLSGLFGPVSRGDMVGPYAVGMSSRVRQPGNASANARFARDPALRPRVSIQPQPSCRPVPAPDAAPGSTPESKVTTADVLEAFHRVTGFPIAADYYTRLYKPEVVSVRNQPLFDALNRLGDAMRLRWNRDGAWLQFRSTSFYDDRLREVPNRLLARWSAVRHQYGILRLDDLVEIAQLSEAQLDAREMAEGARECYGLAEWDLARNHMVRWNLSFLAQFTPAQRQEAMSDTGLPFLKMTLAQQQGFLATAFPAMQPGTGTPMAEGLPPLEQLGGAVLRVDYWQPGWYEWRPPGPALLRWVVPLDLTDEGRRVLRPRVRERTREAALQALRRVDPQIRSAALKVAGRVDPRIEAAPPAEEAQIVPTDLDLATIYYTGATNNCPVLIVRTDSYSR